MQLAGFASFAIVLVTLSLVQAIELTHEPRRPGLQQTRAVEPPAVKPDQLIIVPAPVAPSNCMAFSDASLRATRGSVLCTSQYLAHNVTKVICNEWKPECQQTVTEYTLLDPTAPDAGGQDAYAKTAVAACQLLGYQTFGTGTVHMVGAAKETCWNGKTFSSDNWWTNLVCCKV